MREALQAQGRRAAKQQSSESLQELLETLTPEEFAVFKGVVGGKTNANIAAQLDLSIRTVQFRRTAVMRKLGVSSKSDLMHLVFLAGWSPIGERPEN